MLSRETLTKDVNRVMRSVSSSLPDQTNITSHSFRIGYITQLWKDSKDIEFVKQTIGHRKLDTTSSYVNKLSDQERQKRISQIDSNEIKKYLMIKQIGIHGNYQFIKSYFLKQVK